MVVEKACWPLKERQWLNFVVQEMLMDQINTLKVIDMGIDTHQEPVVYMRSDCHICRSEGFTANSRVMLRYGENSVIATLNVVDEQVLSSGSAGLSKSAMQRLDVDDGAAVSVDHAPVVTSLAAVRKKSLDTNSVIKRLPLLSRTSATTAIRISKSPASSVCARVAV